MRTGFGGVLVRVARVENDLVEFRADSGGSIRNAIVVVSISLRCLRAQDREGDGQTAMRSLVGFLPGGWTSAAPAVHPEHNDGPFSPRGGLVEPTAREATQSMAHGSACA